MPSDANGVFSLVSGYLAVTGETIQASQHNPVLEDLASSMSQRLMRSGAAPMTGPLKIADGSVGSPALQFNSGSSTGFYKTANGFGVAVDGVKVAEFTSGGVSRNLGELIPYTGLTAPALTVLPYGQTLSRSTYADLWTFAQTEIASGNTFYNNGNGSTTFGIGDMRNRVPAGWGKMGGTDAGLLTSAISGVDGKTMGATGGVQGRTINTSNLPNITFPFTGTPKTVTVNSTVSTVSFGGTGNSATTGSDFNVRGGQTVSTLTSTGTYTPEGSVSSGGSGAVFPTTQPTIVCNFLLFAGA